MLNGRKSIKGGAFRLSVFGWAINGLSIFWIAFLTVILCMPPAIKHLTWFSMNYALVVIAAFMALASIGYATWGSKSFTGPLIDTDYFELHNLSARNMVNNDAFVPGSDEDKDDEDQDDTFVHGGPSAKSEEDEDNQNFQVLPDDTDNEVLFERRSEDMENTK